MPHATVFIALVCLTVCHGRPLTPTVPTPEATVPAYPDRLPDPTTPTDLNTGTPLTTVTTTSEDPPPTTIDSTTRDPTTVPSSTATSDHVTDLDSDQTFDLNSCTNTDTTCLFPTHCVFPSAVSSEMQRVSISAAFLDSIAIDDKMRLSDCPLIVRIAGGELVVRRSKNYSTPMATTVREHGLIVDGDGEVQCAGCGTNRTNETSDAFIITYSLPTTVAPETTVPEKTTVTPTMTTTTTVTTPPTRASTTTTVLPVPRPASWDKDQADPDDEVVEAVPADAAARSGEKCGTSVTGIAVICLLVIIAFVLLAIVVCICITQHKLKVQPVASPMAKMQPAWSSKRSTPATSNSRYSVSVAAELPAPHTVDESEDFEERTPLAAVSPAPRSAKSSATPLLARTIEDQDRDRTMPDFSGRPPTPPKVSPTNETVSVTPSKDAKQILNTTDRKNLDGGTGIFPNAVAGMYKPSTRTPLIVKLPTPGPAPTPKTTFDV